MGRPRPGPLYDLQNKLNLVHRFLIIERTDSCLIQVDLALGGHQLGHVADQPHAQPRRNEVPPDQVGGEHRLLRPPGQPAPSAQGDPDHAMLAHQAFDLPGVHHPRGPTQRGMDPRAR